MTLRVRGLLEIAAEGDMLSPAARIHHAHSLHPARTDLPPLQIGATFLEHWPIREEPGAITWRAPGYDCMAPATFILRDVIVHGSGGIIRIGDDVVAETLIGRDPDAHGFRRTPGGIELAAREPRHLAGTHVSVLAGSKRNYFHSLLDGIMRLVMIPDYYLHISASLLCPQDGVAQAASLDLLGLPASLARQEIGDAEALHIDTLVFPWDLYGLSSFHPCVTSYFSRVSEHVGPGGDFPTRFYIDRRNAVLRQLVNEVAVIEELAKFGIVAIRPETLSIPDQVRLFRGAEMIVAPHGAALTNLGFCQPGCALLELHMDAYVHWCYRHFAAVCGVRYDCVLGRAVGAWPDAPEMVQALSWQVHVPHVVAAVLQMGR